MNKYHPLFYALTTHTKNKTKHYEFLKLTDIFPNNVLLHLIANNLTRADAKSILEEALKCGIRNVFALRGGKEIFLKNYLCLKRYLINSKNINFRLHNCKQ